jgi:hypothetical protein
MSSELQELITECQEDNTLAGRVVRGRDAILNDHKGTKVWVCPYITPENSFNFDCAFAYNIGPKIPCGCGVYLPQTNGDEEE